MGTDDSTLMLTGPLYDRLKFFALVILPGLGALYFGIAQLWGLPAATEVVGTITIIDTFLGAILKASSHSYQKSEVGITGDLVFEQYPNGEIAGMRLESRVDPFIPYEGEIVQFKATRDSVEEPELK